MLRGDQSPAPGPALFKIEIARPRNRAELLGRSDCDECPRDFGRGRQLLRCVATAKELRNNVAGVLRRAEAGELFTITVAGRPVAQLGPTARRQWVGGRDLKRVFQTPAPQTLADDLQQLPAELVDPFA